MFQDIKGLTEQIASYVELIAKNEQVRYAVNNVHVLGSRIGCTYVPVIEGNGQFVQGVSEGEP